MNDDTFCLFVILTCMITLAVPAGGQVIVAAFGLGLAVLAQLSPGHDDAGSPDYLDRHDITG